MKLQQGLLIIFLNLFFCCDNKEVKRDYYPNGKIRMEQEFRNGIKDGLTKIYDEKGNLLESKSYTNDSLDGSCIKFYQNGKIRERINFTHAIENGVYQRYYPNGILGEEGKYQDGHRRGIVKQFLPTGKLKFISYVISFKGFEGSSWIEEYDDNANLIKEQRKVIVDFDRDSYWSGKKTEIKFEILKKTKCDSSSIIFGDFDFDFNIAGKIDTVKLIEKKGSWIVPAGKKKSYLRGKWIIYSSWVGIDTIYHATTFDYFEELPIGPPE